MSKNQLTRSQIEGLLGKPLKRFAVVERAEPEVDEEARTIRMSFSSDAPVDEWFGKLILNHAPGCIRFERIRAGGPFLLDHDRTKLAGVHAEIDTDGHKTRGLIRFSQTQLGKDTFQDIKDGIRPNTSVRAVLYELHLVREDEDSPVYQSDDWEIVENSSVTMPGDISVGVGRALGVCGCDGEGCDVCASAAPAELSTNSEAGASRSADPETGANEERAADTSTTQARNTMERETEIRDLGEMLGEQELARDYIADETKTVADFRAAVRGKRTAARGITEPPTPDPATTAARQGGDQPARVTSRATLRAFRGEGGEQLALRAGHFLRAALHRNEASLQFCREHGISVARAHSESDNESGGVLVPTEFENVMIDLRLQYGTFRRVANVVPMASARKERPRRKGGLTAYPIGARGTNRRLTASKKGWDLVGLDAKKWGVLAKYEEELSDDGVIQMADDLTSEMAYAFTQIEDECGFLGDGTSDYHGIVGLINRLRNPGNASAAPAVANVAGLVEASGNAWSEIELIDILALVGRLPSFARNSGQVAWYCSNEFWATVLCRIAMELGGNALGQIQNVIQPVFLGKPVEIVEVMPHVEANSHIPLLYGNVAQAAMFGDRRGVTVKMTDSNDTDFEEDLIAVKATERFDINVHDAGTASATASERKAGPVVALITKAA